MDCTRDSLVGSHCKSMCSPFATRDPRRRRLPHRQRSMQFHQITLSHSLNVILAHSWRCHQRTPKSRGPIRGIGANKRKALFAALIFFNRASPPAARGPAAQGRGFRFAYPALIPQRANAPRKRTGLLSFVPCGTGVLRTRACHIPRLSEKERPDTRRQRPSVSFLLCRGDAIRKPAGLSRGGLAAQGRGVCAHLSRP
jgi:hypothetical protein